jgi:hypothetical protein
MAHFLVILTVLGYSFREQMVSEIKKEAVVRFPNIGPKSGLSSLYEPRDFVEYLRSTRKVSGAEFGIAEGFLLIKKSPITLVQLGQQMHLSGKQWTKCAHIKQRES